MTRIKIKTIKNQFTGHKNIVAPLKLYVQSTQHIMLHCSEKGRIEALCAMRSNAQSVQWAKSNEQWEMDNGQWNLDVQKWIERCFKWKTESNAVMKNISRGNAKIYACHCTSFKLSSVQFGSVRIGRFGRSLYQAQANFSIWHKIQVMLVRPNKAIHTYTSTHCRY